MRLMEIFDDESPETSWGWWVYPDGEIAEIDMMGGHGPFAYGWLTDHGHDLKEDYDAAIDVLIQLGGIRLNTYHGSRSLNLDMQTPTRAAMAALRRFLRDYADDFEEFVFDEHTVVRDPVAVRNVLAKRAVRSG